MKDAMSISLKIFFIFAVTFSSWVGKSIAENGVDLGVARLAPNEFRQGPWKSEIRSTRPKTVLDIGVARIDAAEYSREENFSHATLVAKTDPAVGCGGVLIQKETLLDQKARVKSTLKRHQHRWKILRLVAAGQTTN